MFLFTYLSSHSGSKAVVTFTKPECLIRPEAICGVGMATDSNVLIVALEKYRERKMKNVEDKITNKLVLRLPFDSESKCSQELLGHNNGIVCPMVKAPLKLIRKVNGLQNEPEMYASRSLILTFKAKSSNFTSRKKAVVKVGITPAPFSSGFARGSGRGGGPSNDGSNRRPAMDSRKHP